MVTLMISDISPCSYPR